MIGLDSEKRADSGAGVLARFVVGDGTPGAQRA